MEDTPAAMRLLALFERGSLTQLLDSSLESSSGVVSIATNFVSGKIGQHDGLRILMPDESSPRGIRSVSQEPTLYDEKLEASTIAMARRDNRRIPMLESPRAVESILSVSSRCSGSTGT